MQNAVAARKPPFSPRRLAYGINDFASALGIGRTKIYEEIKSGRLRAKRIGGRTIIAADDAAKYLAGLPALSANPIADPE